MGGSDGFECEQGMIDASQTVCRNEEDGVSELSCKVGQEFVVIERDMPSPGPFDNEEVVSGLERPDPLHETTDIGCGRPGALRCDVWRERLIEGERVDHIGRFRDAVGHGQQRRV